MIRIVKNGWDKVYIMVCGKCDTTFTYQREDTYVFEGCRHVKCPVCSNNRCKANLIECSHEYYEEIAEDEKDG